MGGRLMLLLTLYLKRSRPIEYVDTSHLFSNHFWRRKTRKTVSPGALSFVFTAKLVRQTLEKSTGSGMVKSAESLFLHCLKKNVEREIACRLGMGILISSSGVFQTCFHAVVLVSLQGVLSMFYFSPTRFRSLGITR